MSRNIRFFVESLTGDIVMLPPEESHHALHVLRLAAGDTVELFDGAGGRAVGEVDLPGKGRVWVQVRSRPPAVGRPEPLVELAFAVPKGKRLDWLLEKATELGAARLAPVVFERSVARPEESEHARQRWRSICIAALKQSQGDFLPELAAPAGLSEYLNSCRSAVKLIGAPAAARSVPAALADWAPGQAVSLLIGPEGGLTEPELSQAQSAGFAAVRLGRQILRVETAALALLAAATMLCQDEQTTPPHPTLSQRERNEEGTSPHPNEKKVP